MNANFLSNALSSGANVATNAANSIRAQDQQLIDNDFASQRLGQANRRISISEDINNRNRAAEEQQADLFQAAQTSNMAIQLFNNGDIQGAVRGLNGFSQTNAGKTLVDQGFSEAGDTQGNSSTVSGDPFNIWSINPKNGSLVLGNSKGELLTDDRSTSGNIVEFDPKVIFGRLSASGIGQGAVDNNSNVNADREIDKLKPAGESQSQSFTRGISALRTQRDIEQETIDSTQANAPQTTTPSLGSTQPAQTSDITQGQFSQQAETRIAAINKDKVLGKLAKVSKIDKEVSFLGAVGPFSRGQIGERTKIPVAINPKVANSTFVEALSIAPEETRAAAKTLLDSGRLQKRLQSAKDPKEVEALGEQLDLMQSIVNGTYKPAVTNSDTVVPKTTSVDQDLKTPQGRIKIIDQQIDIFNEKLKEAKGLEKISLQARKDNLKIFNRIGKLPSAVQMEDYLRTGDMQALQRDVLNGRIQSSLGASVVQRNKQKNDLEKVRLEGVDTAIAAASRFFDGFAGGEAKGKKLSGAFQTLATQFRSDPNFSAPVVADIAAVWGPMAFFAFNPLDVKFDLAYYANKLSKFNLYKDLDFEDADDVAVITDSAKRTMNGLAPSARRLGVSNTTIANIYSTEVSKLMKNGTPLASALTKAIANVSKIKRI